MNENLVEKIRCCPTLPSLPAIALQVLELAQNEEVDIAEIARVISKDPALSSKILRTVNSSFYARPQRISTISHALVILGLQSVKTLVLGFSLVTNLAKNKTRGFKHLAYWRRSIYAATAARTLASKLQLVQQEECFLAALLMDLGMLVLDQVMGDAYGEVCEKASSHLALAAVELESLGMTHADAARILAEQWKLPPVLATPMGYHHNPEQVQDESLRKLADVIALSAMCADVFVDEKAAGAITAVRAHCQEHYQISEDACDAMLDEICTRTKEVAPLFEISLGSATSYEAILKKANEALVELTLRTQQQAASLQRQNIRLKEAAATDGLTGLANRGAFDKFIGEQFEAAVKADKPLSMLMMDVDKFKSINDTYGHPAGDEVLKAVGKIIKGAARAQDMAARYGGEEMVLVMPATGKGTAAAVAESIRRTIATRPIVCEKRQLPVTVSVGVATMESGMPFTQHVHLIKAADRALYAAKDGGRNNVKVFSIKADGEKTAA